MLITVKLLLQTGIPLQVDLKCISLFFLSHLQYTATVMDVNQKHAGQPIRRKLAQRAEGGKTACLRQSFMHVVHFTDCQSIYL